MVLMNQQPQVYSGDGDTLMQEDVPDRIIRVPDAYPSPGLWRVAPTAVFARYPFGSSLDERRNGGF